MYEVFAKCVTDNADVKRKELREAASKAGMFVPGGFHKTDDGFVSVDFVDAKKLKAIAVDGVVIETNPLDFQLNEFDHVIAHIRKRCGWENVTFEFLDGELNKVSLATGKQYMICVSLFDLKTQDMQDLDPFMKNPYAMGVDLRRTMIDAIRANLPGKSTVFIPGIITSAFYPQILFFDVVGLPKGQSGTKIVDNAYVAAEKEMKKICKASWLNTPICLPCMSEPSNPPKFFSGLQRMEESYIGMMGEKKGVTEKRRTVLEMEGLAGMTIMLAPGFAPTDDDFLFDMDDDDNDKDEE